METSTQILKKLTSLRLDGISASVKKFFQPLQDDSILSSHQRALYRQFCGQFLKTVHELLPGVTDDGQKQRLVDAAIVCGAAARHVVNYVKEPDAGKYLPYLLCQIIHKTKCKESVGDILKLTRSVLALWDPGNGGVAPEEAHKYLIALDSTLWHLSSTPQLWEMSGDHELQVHLLQLWQCSLLGLCLIPNKRMLSERVEQIVRRLTSMEDVQSSNGQYGQQENAVGQKDSDLSEKTTEKNKMEQSAATLKKKYANSKKNALKTEETCQKTIGIGYTPEDIYAMFGQVLEKMKQSIDCCDSEEEKAEQQYYRLTVTLTLIEYLSKCRSTSLIINILETVCNSDTLGNHDYKTVYKGVIEFLIAAYSLDNSDGDCSSLDLNILTSANERAVSLLKSPSRTDQDVKSIVQIYFPVVQIFATDLMRNVDLDVVEVLVSAGDVFYQATLLMMPEKCPKLMKQFLSALQHQLQFLHEVLLATGTGSGYEQLLTHCWRVVESFHRLMASEHFKQLSSKIQHHNRYYLGAWCVRLAQFCHGKQMRHEHYIQFYEVSFVYLKELKQYMKKPVLMQCSENLMECYIMEGKWVEATRVVMATLRLDDASVKDSMELWYELKQQALQSDVEMFSSMTFYSVLHNLDLCNIMEMTEKQLLVQEYIMWRNQSRRNFNVEYHLLCELCALCLCEEELQVVQLELGTVMSVAGLKYRDKEAVDILTEAIDSQPSCPGVLALLMYSRYSILQEQALQKVQSIVKDLSASTATNLPSCIQYTLHMEQNYHHHLVQAVELWEKHFSQQTACPSSCGKEEDVTIADSIADIVDKKRHLDGLIFCGTRLLAMKQPDLATRALALALDQLASTATDREEVLLRCSLARSLMLLGRYEMAVSRLTGDGGSEDKVDSGSGARNEEEGLVRAELSILTGKCDEGLSIVKSLLEQISGSKRFKSAYFKTGVAKRLLSMAICLSGRPVDSGTTESCAKNHVTKPTNQNLAECHVTSQSLLMLASESVYSHLAVLNSMLKESSTSTVKWVYLYEVLESILYLSRLNRLNGLPREGRTYMYEGLRISQAQGLPRWSCEFLQEIIQLESFAGCASQALSAACALNVVHGRMEPMQTSEEQSTPQKSKVNQNHEMLEVNDDPPPTVVCASDLNCFGFEGLCSPLTLKSRTEGTSVTSSSDNDTDVSVEPSQNVTPERRVPAEISTDDLEASLSEFGVIECPCLNASDTACKDVVHHRLCLKSGIVIAEFLSRMERNDLAQLFMENIESKFVSGVFCSDGVKDISNNILGRADAHLKLILQELLCLQADIYLKRKEYQKMRNMFRGCAITGLLDETQRILYCNTLSAQLALCERAMLSVDKMEAPNSIVNLEMDEKSHKQVTDIGSNLELDKNNQTSVEEVTNDLLRLSVETKKVSCKKARSTNSRVKSAKKASGSDVVTAIAEVESAAAGGISSEQKANKNPVKNDDVSCTPSNKIFEKLMHSSKKQKMNQIYETPLNCRKVALDFLMESDEDDIFFPPPKPVTPATNAKSTRKTKAKIEPRKSRNAASKTGSITTPVCKLASLWENSPEQVSVGESDSAKQTDTVHSKEKPAKQKKHCAINNNTALSINKLINKTDNSSCVNLEALAEGVEDMKLSDMDGESLKLNSESLSCVSENSVSQNIDAKQKSVKSSTRKGRAGRIKETNTKENDAPTKSGNSLDNDSESLIECTNLDSQKKLTRGKPVHRRPERNYRKVVEVTETVNEVFEREADNSGGEVEREQLDEQVELTENTKRLLKFGGFLSKEHCRNAELDITNDVYDFVPSPSVNGQKTKGKRRVTAKERTKAVGEGKKSNPGLSKQKPTKSARTNKNIVTKRTKSDSGNVDVSELDDIEMTREICTADEKCIKLKDLDWEFEGVNLDFANDNTVMDIYDLSPLLMPDLTLSPTVATAADDDDDITQADLQGMGFPLAYLSEVTEDLANMFNGQLVTGSPARDELLSPPISEPSPLLGEHVLDDFIVEISDYELNHSTELSPPTIRHTDTSQIEMGLSDMELLSSPECPRFSQENDMLDPIEKFRGQRTNRKTRCAKTRMEESSVVVSQDELPPKASSPDVGQGPAGKSLSSHLEMLYDSLSPLAPYPQFPHICQALAMDHLDNDPTKAALYLSNAMYVAFRHMVLLNDSKKIRRALRNNTSEAGDTVGGDETIIPPAGSLMFHTDKQHLQDMIDTLPPDWSVIQISYITAGQPRPRKILTRFAQGQAPVVIRLPDSECPILESFSEVMKGFTTLSQHKEKAAWWKLRHKQNEEIKELVKNMEDCWLGHWAGLLTPRQYSADTVQKVSDELIALIPAPIEQAHVEVLLQCCSQRPDIQSMLLCAREILRKHDLKEEELQEVVFVIKKWAKPITKPTQHVVLLLDKEIQQLPWERMPVLEETSVSRMFCLAHVCSQLTRFQARSNSVFVKGVDASKVFYVLNPDQDCPNAEKKFKDWFQKEPGWNGVCCARPTHEQFSEGITQHDLFIYVGHGAGGRYFARTEIEKLRGHAAALLMGCSSGKLIASGQLEPDGIMVSYFLAGCPCMVANLWDVTDVDIDLYTERLLSLWLNGAGSVSLCQAVQNARQACKMKYIVGAAPVVYGLPVVKSSK